MTGKFRLTTEILLPAIFTLVLHRLSTKYIELPVEIPVNRTIIIMRSDWPYEDHILERTN